MSNEENVSELLHLRKRVEALKSASHRVRWPQDIREQVLALRARLSAQAIAAQTGLDAHTIYAWSAQARRASDGDGAPHVMRVVDLVDRPTAASPGGQPAGVGIKDIEIRVGHVRLIVAVA